MDIKKLFLFVIMGIFLISMVSATLDVKSFDPTAKNFGEIKVKDWLFLQKADYKLMDYGADVFDVWAEGEYKLHKKTHLFTGVFYKNLKGGKGQLEDVKYFIWKEENSTYQDPIYEENCWLDYTNSTSGDQICEQVNTGELKERVEDTSHWIPYEKGMELESQEGKWRFEATRPKNKQIDFVLEAHGKTFDEWAWFNETWQLKKYANVTIDGQANLDNFWVEVTIPFETGKMASDWSDLRIVNADENATHTFKYDYKNSTEMHLWIWAEEGVGTVEDNLFEYYIYYNVTTPVTYGWDTGFYYGDTFVNVTSDEWASDESGGTFDYNSGFGGSLKYTGNGGGYSSIYHSLPSAVKDWANVTIQYKTTWDNHIPNDGSYHYLGLNDNGVDPNPDEFIGMFLNGRDASYGNNLANVWADNILGTTKDVDRPTTSNPVIATIIQTGASSTSSTSRLQRHIYGANGFTGDYTETTSSYQGSTTPALHIKSDDRYAGQTTYTSYILISNGNGTTESYEFGEEEEASKIDFTLNSPIDYYNSTSSDVLFNCSATDDVGIYSLNLTIDNIVVETVTGDGTTDLSLQSTETIADGDHTWYCTADSDLSTENSTTRSLTIDTTPFIEFLTPPTLENYANITSETIPIGVNVSTDYFFNISYDLYNINGTTFNQYYETETYDYNFTDIPDGHYHYNVTTCTTTGRCNTTETRHINQDTTPPILSSLNNFTDFLTETLPINSTWNYTAEDEAIDSCYFNTTENSTYTIIPCNSTVNTTWTTNGQKSIQYCANDTFGNEACDTESIWVIEYSQTDDPDPVAEGFNVDFTLTLNATSIPTLNAILHFNGTAYSSTSTSTTNSYVFSTTVLIPDGLGNTTGVLHDWVWEVNDTVELNTSTENITVYELAIDDCSTYSDVILEMNLYDEETNTAVNESAGANVEIDLQLTSKTNSDVYLQFNKTYTNENNPKVCIPANVLNNSEYWIDFTIGFDSTDRVWEFYYLDDGTLNSTKIFDVQTSTPINLMDLLTADSTSFLFNYFDQDGLAVEDAIVHVYRKYIGSGVFREVERAKADLNGDTIVHLVEEDVIYYFVISQYGDILFTSSQYTALCQSSPCTIQIEASGESAEFDTDWDLIDGGAYTITDNPSTRTVNLTYSLNDTSTMNLTVYKYNNDGSYSIVETGSNTGSTGSVILTVPQSAGNVSFFATVYQDDDFVNSEWVDFEGDAQDRFGTTLALFIGALIILSLGLMAVTEGVGTLVFVILGVALAGFLGLVTTELSTGVNIVVYLVVAGGILLWKLTGGRR